MKKIDKLIIGSFLGPFFLTFFVVIFILLSQFMLKYLDEIVGKDLDSTVIAQLIFYFSVYLTPQAFPLAVLLSSLMTFGNLGEHFELIALKSSGISLIRVLVPIFVFTLLLTGAAYYSNNYIVPKANLKAFSLLYDVKQMKPSMELKEGTFYNGIDGYSIKVGEKYPDGKSLKDLVIYDHTENQGNRRITLADSGRMYNILGDRYLVLEMYNGNTYSEEKSSKRGVSSENIPDPLIRNSFESQKVVFNLASFDLKRTKEDLFSSNRLMKNAFQLRADVDSMKTEFDNKTEEVKEQSFQFFDFHMQDVVGIYKERAIQRAEEARREQELKDLKLEDSLRKIKKMNPVVRRVDQNGEEKDSVTAKNGPVYAEKMERDSISAFSKKPKTAFPKIDKNKKGANILAKQKDETKLRLEKLNKTVNIDNTQKETDSIIAKPTFEENIAIIDSIMNSPDVVKSAFSRSLTHVRYVKNNMMMREGQLENLKSEINKFQLERYKKFSLAFTILTMFFIGAPLGAIIKRGGLGIPVLISLSFFILFYVISMICEKWTRSDVMDPVIAAWMANIILLPVGMFFMKQAKNDARLFETDFYSVIFVKIRTAFFSIKSKFKKNK